METEIEFEKEKETKRTIRFKERTDPGHIPKIGTIYVQKFLFEEGVPDRVKLKISW